MKILVNINSTTELHCYEAIALAMTLATFDHELQLWLSKATFGVLLEPNSRLTGMIKALDLYDIPPAWLDENFNDTLLTMLDTSVITQLKVAPKKIDLTDFDEVLAL